MDSTKAAIQELKLLKEAVNQTIKAIKAYRLKQKALYRSYYQANDKLTAFVEAHKEQESYEILKALSEVNTEGIFFKK